MRFLLILFPFLTKFGDLCAPTRTTTPIVCPCTTSEVALLSKIDGTVGENAYITPVGTVASQDSNQCPTSYTVTCDPPADQPAATVFMFLQDSISGGLEGINSISLTCTNGNWIYSSDNNGQILVVSVSCLYVV